MNGRLIKGLSNSEYHSDSSISRSDLMKISISPFHFKNRASDEFKRTDQMLLGEIVHCGILEPDELLKRFAALPKINRTTKEGKLKYSELLEQHAGKELVSDAIWTDAMCCINRFKSKDALQPLLNNSHKEASIFFEEPLHGIACKSRPDLFKSGVVLDIKTTANASPRAFQTSCIQYGYFLQAAMASMALQSIGIVMEKFIIWAVETKFPFATAVYVMDEDAISFGFSQFNKYIEILHDCAEKGEYSDFGVQILSKPEWVK